MWVVVGFVVHVALIYAGAQLAQLQYFDVWRCAGVGCLSYVAMFVLGGIVVPLVLLGAPVFASPYLKYAVDAAALGLATAVAARLVLSAGWTPSWTIGATVAAANMLWSMLTFTAMPGCIPGGG